MQIAELTQDARPLIDRHQHGVRRFEVEDIHSIGLRCRRGRLLLRAADSADLRRAGRPDEGGVLTHGW
jgi:hypothetical protein